MILLCRTPLPSSGLLAFRPPLTPSLSFSTSISNLESFYRLNNNYNKIRKKKINRALCRAEFSHDAPFAAAIGACMLSSLLLPVTPARNEDGGDSVMDGEDTRFAVMGIISFIPYFNWLSWVFAWLDTGKRRYAIYSLVYLAPYLRSNLSLSPEESWLPVASIVFCIIHIQLEVSIRNGDFQGFQLFSKAAERFPSITRKKDSHFEGHERLPEKLREIEHMNPPPVDDRSRNETLPREAHERPSEHQQQLNEDWDDE